MLITDFIRLFSSLSKKIKVPITAITAILNKKMVNIQELLL